MGKERQGIVGLKGIGLPGRENPLTDVGEWGLAPKYPLSNIPLDSPQALNKEMERYDRRYVRQNTID